MAAEKLTTARLVQILVVLTLLIAAFTWRTFNYSNSQNKDQCSLNSGACSVDVSGGTVEIMLFNQEDGGVALRVDSPEKPSSLTSTFPKTNIDLTARIDNKNDGINATFIRCQTMLRLAKRKNYCWSLIRIKLKLTFNRKLMFVRF